jgi:uncharacterized membrane protein
MVFWVAGLAVNLANIKFFTDEQPMRLWTALIGLPMLITFIVDIFWQFPSPYGIAALWAITLLTVLVLISLRLYFRFKGQQLTQPQQPEQPAI